MWFFFPTAQCSHWLFSVFNWKIGIAGLGVYLGVCSTACPCHVCSLHWSCPSEEEEEGERGWRCDPIPQRQNYSRNPRLRGKGWKIYSSIDSATRSFLNSGLQSHFAIQKIHFSPLAQLWEEWESAVDVSREMFLFNPVSAHLSCLYWQKGNLMKWQSWDEMGFICLHPPSSLPSPQTSLFILHDERCPH